MLQIWLILLCKDRALYWCSVFAGQAPSYLALSTDAPYRKCNSFKYFFNFLGSGAWICQVGVWICQLGVWNCQLSVWNSQLGVWNCQLGVWNCQMDVYWQALSCLPLSTAESEILNILIFLLFFFIFEINGLAVNWLRHQIGS